MPRSIWNGSISFGLVNVPVQLFSAVEPKDIALPRVPSRDRARGSSTSACRRRPAARSSTHDIEKGYETSRGKYVMLTQEELESVEPGQSRTIDIEDFVELAEIDPIYFDKPYYVAPQKGAEKPYALLRDAMANSERVAIAPLRHAHQAVPRGDPRRRRRARARDAVLRRRDPRRRAISTSRSARRCRTASCAIAEQLIDSLTIDVEAGALRGHVPRARARPRPAQGQGPGDRGRAARARRSAKVVDLVEALATQPRRAKASGRRAGRRSDDEDARRSGRPSAARQRARAS